MTPGRDTRAYTALERAIVAASLAQTARHRIALEQLTSINHELVAEAARLAARIADRLSPRGE